MSACRMCGRQGCTKCAADLAARAGQTQRCPLCTRGIKPTPGKWFTIENKQLTAVTCPGCQGSALVTYSPDGLTYAPAPAHLDRDDHRFPIGEPDANGYAEPADCVCGYTFAEYDWSMGEAIAADLERQTEARIAEQTSEALRQSVDNLNMLASEADAAGDQRTAQQLRGGMTSAAMAYLESIGAIEPQGD